MNKMESLQAALCAFSLSLQLPQTGSAHFKFGALSEPAGGMNARRDQRRFTGQPTPRSDYNNHKTRGRV
jgi:hypothetical protein